MDCNGARGCSMHTSAGSMLLSVNHVKLLAPVQVQHAGHAKRAGRTSLFSCELLGPRPLHCLRRGLRLPISSRCRPVAVLIEAVCCRLDLICLGSSGSGKHASQQIENPSDLRARCTARHFTCLVGGNCTKGTATQQKQNVRSFLGLATMSASMIARASRQQSGSAVMPAQSCWQTRPAR